MFVEILLIDQLHIPTLILKLYVLQELFPFHAKFNKNNIYFFPYNFNIVTTYEFSIWYKMILYFLKRFTYLKIIRKLFSFLLLLPDKVQFYPM
jgi:hypothetical protein